MATDTVMAPVHPGEIPARWAAGVPAGAGEELSVPLRPPVVRACSMS
jgi:hypothetical protein